MDNTIVVLLMMYIKRYDDKGNVGWDKLPTFSKILQNTPKYIPNTPQITANTPKTPP